MSDTTPFKEIDQAGTWWRKTQRTDALVRKVPKAANPDSLADAYSDMLDHARQLERELDEANGWIAVLKRERDEWREKSLNVIRPITCFQCGQTADAWRDRVVPMKGLLCEKCCAIDRASKGQA